jgi:hypothetical protein
MTGNHTKVVKSAVRNNGWWPVLFVETTCAIRRTTISSTMRPEESPAKGYNTMGPLTNQRQATYLVQQR